MSNMKAWIYVRPPETAVAGSSPPTSAPKRVCWYVGTSDGMVERSLRAQLGLPSRARLLLRDDDGDHVPVSASLPPGEHFTLVLMPPDPDDDLDRRCSSCSTSPSGGEAAVRGLEDAAMETSVRDKKRRRHSALEAAIRRAETMTDPSGLSLVRTEVERTVLRPVAVPRARSVARVVTQFLSVFTRPIADDDNVSFIPSSGRFSLYALFCALVSDRSLHPKSQDAFYKVTSMQGRVDRLRAIRYYRAPAGSGVECVRYKPQGKGPLLRQYLAVDSASALADAARNAAPLAAVLGRDADETVARYMDFVRGFAPVSKEEYQAYRHAATPVDEAVGSDTNG